MSVYHMLHENFGCLR